MAMDPDIKMLHDLAVARGEPGYIDPANGLFVLTSQSLLRQRSCCGRGCRHCPWPPEEQWKAGRPGTPPPVTH